jgi:hypothetical protein
MTENKVVPFPTPNASPVSDPISKRHQRVILSIGRQRLAFDFYSQVTELNPEPAPVVPFTKAKRGRRPRSPVAAGDGGAD